jgi:methionyl-tRNA synthetase
MDEENGTDQECWMGGSFGAVAKDGYGVAYHFMGKDRIAFHVSSYHSSPSTSSERLRKHICESLKEMIQLF